MSKVQHIPIFVGSTYTDLMGYRDAVKDALHRLEFIVKGMEYFGSKPGAPIDECMNAVRSSQVYIGVFGMRYGSIPPGYSKSMTHLEYDEAQYIKLPSLIYIIDEESQPILPKHVETGPGAEKLSELKKTLKENHLVSSFTTEEDLATRISQDLPELLKDMGTSFISPEAGKEGFNVECMENRAEANLNTSILDANERIKIIQTNMSTVVKDYIDDLERAIIDSEGRSGNFEVSLLTLDPESYFSAMRAKQLGVDVHGFRKEMRDALEVLRERLGKYPCVSIRIYDDFPTQVCFIIDDIIYNCTVTKHQQSRYNCVFKLDSRQPALFKSFVQHFTSVWIDKNTTREYAT